MTVDGRRNLGTALGSRSFTIHEGEDGLLAEVCSSAQ